MSTGKLKAQYNRVRTSVALQANSMWTQTIGVNRDPQAGSNAVIEARLKAPVHGGRGREARRMAAKALMEEAGYEPAVTSFEGLVALARAQGSIGGSNRGACKVCGGMGHLAKQCKNHLSNHFERAPESSAAPRLPLLTEDTEVSSLSASSGGESSSSDEEARRKRRKERRKDRKRRHKREEARRKEGKKRSRDRDRDRERSRERGHHHKRRKAERREHRPKAGSEESE